MSEIGALGLSVVSARDIVLDVEKKFEGCLHIMQLAVDRIRSILLIYRPLIALNYLFLLRKMRQERR
jgi:hypothetical protein